MPEAVCRCSLGFASIALLSTGAGLVVLNLPAVKYLGRGGAVCSTFWKNIFFKEACAIMASMRGFGFKNRNFWGFFSGKRSQKPFHDCDGQGCYIISLAE